MTNFNYDNYDDDTKAKYDDGIEFLDDDFSFDEEDDDDNVYDIPRYSDEPVAPHNHKEKQETIGQEILSYIKILAVAVIVAFLYQIYNCKRSGSIWFNGKHHSYRRQTNRFQTCLSVS